jgi:hypothetical protein
MLLTDGDTKLPDVLDLGVDTQAGAGAKHVALTDRQPGRSSFSSRGN